MVTCVASLVGRGYDDPTIAEAVGGWWRHFHELGRIRTPPAEAGREVGKTLAMIRGSDRFAPAVGTGGHREACRAIGLTAAGWAMLGRSPGGGRVRSPVRSRWRAEHQY